MADIPQIRFPADLGTEQLGHVMILTPLKKKGGGPEAQFAFYIPGATAGSSMTWTHAHEYTDVKLTRLVTGMLGVFGDVAAGLATLAGKPLNPNVDVLFRNTNLREYQFNVLMAPQSEKDAKAMKDIIFNLRYFAASELGDVTYDAPNEFSIKFYYWQEGRLIENKNIPKIATGVVKRVDVDYNPGGEWSTFQDGTPVSAMLTFTYMETKIIAKKQIKDGY